MKNLWEILVANLVVLLLFLAVTAKDNDSAGFMMGFAFLMIINMVLGISMKEREKSFVLSALIVLVVGFSLCSVSFKMRN